MYDVLLLLCSLFLLAVPCVWFVLYFPDHTHILLEAMTKKKILHYLTNVHRSDRYEACNKI